MDKYSAADLEKADKDIGKDLMEQYPDRIRIEKNADVDPKVFQKNEAGYASSYKRS